MTPSPRPTSRSARSSASKAACGCRAAGASRAAATMRLGVPGRDRTAGAGRERPPDMRTFILPRKDYQIVRDWDVFGLQATGSHGIVVDKAFVPEYRTHKASDGFHGTNRPGGQRRSALPAPVGVFPRTRHFHRVPSVPRRRRSTPITSSPRGAYRQHQEEPADGSIALNTAAPGRRLQSTSSRRCSSTTST